MARRAVAVVIAIMTCLRAGGRPLADEPAAPRPAPPRDLARASPEAAPAKHYLRAGLQTVGALAFATVWYWTNVDLNAPDWDIGWDWPSWRRKLGSLEPVRLDTNELETNAVSHSRSGTILVQIARANGLGLGEAVLSTAAATLLWEYVGEYRELPSLNDLVVNPFAGLALGEPLFRLGELLRGAHTAPARALGALLSPFAALNDAMDGRSPRRNPGAGDALGLPRSVWHRIALRAGAASARFDGGGERRGFELGLEVELADQPGLGRSGRRSDAVRPGAWSGIAAGALVGDRGIAGGELASQVVFAGHHWQWMPEAPVEAEVAPGAGLLVGLASAFTFTWQDTPDGERDIVASVGLAGPRLDLWAQRGELRARLRAQLTLDLAMLTSHAAAAAPDRAFAHEAKSTLQTRGYYFAHGATLLGRASLEGRWWDLAGLARLGAFESIDGRDRFQEGIEDDFHLSDRRLWLAAEAGLRWGWMRVAAGAERVVRAGQLAGVPRTSRELRLRAGMGVVF